MNHEEMENLNRPKMTEEIKAVIKHLSTKESSESDSFSWEFYQSFKESMPILLKFVQKN